MWALGSPTGAAKACLRFLRLTIWQAEGHCAASRGSSRSPTTIHDAASGTPACPTSMLRHDTSSCSIRRIVAELIESCRPTKLTAHRHGTCSHRSAKAVIPGCANTEATPSGAFRNSSRFCCSTASGTVWASSIRLVRTPPNAKRRNSTLAWGSTSPAGSDAMRGAEHWSSSTVFDYAQHAATASPAGVSRVDGACRITCWIGWPFISAAGQKTVQYECTDIASGHVNAFIRALCAHTILDSIR